MRAIWNGEVIAESDDAVKVDGNHYFPADSVPHGILEESTTRSTCPWKGTASYFSIVVEGDRNEDAVWSYPDPKDDAKEIAGRLAFWRGVEVTD